MPKKVEHTDSQEDEDAGVLQCHTEVSVKRESVDDIFINGDSGDKHYPEAGGKSYGDADFVGCVENCGKENGESKKPHLVLMDPECKGVGGGLFGDPLADNSGREVGVVGDDEGNNANDTQQN